MLGEKVISVLLGEFTYSILILAAFPMNRDVATAEAIAEAVQRPTMAREPIGDREARRSHRVHAPTARPGDRDDGTAPQRPGGMSAGDLAEDGGATDRAAAHEDEG
jgi:hypothetical protein